MVGRIGNGASIMIDANTVSTGSLPQGELPRLPVDGEPAGLVGIAEAPSFENGWKRILLRARGQLDVDEEGTVIKRQTAYKKVLAIAVACGVVGG